MFILYEPTTKPTQRQLLIKIKINHEYQPNEPERKKKVKIKLKINNNNGAPIQTKRNSTKKKQIKLLNGKIFKGKTHTLASQIE